MRKTVSLFAAIGAVLAFVLVPARTVQASADGSQSVYANALLADGATYLWANAYQYRGQGGGLVALGDLGGINLLLGAPDVVTFPTPVRPHLAGPGAYNGMVCTFEVDLTGNANMRWHADIAGVPVWSGDSGFLWAGMVFQP